MIGKLYVRVIAAPAVPGKKALALCTEDGEMVGMQMSTVVDCEATDIGTVTVRFYIDGEKICFASNDDTELQAKPGDPPPIGRS